ncbi:hypothetical protein [Novosphingobium sp.]|uniref:hypothetical protein n=1 Tax=Novosphingobium sp. TaxID=1874826 RepID=UPI0025E3571C|nr:hypothetical protein [Novosphingobium sp.]MCC6925980.1 hypothetical protein [Novosphingobium sp.]
MKTLSKALAKGTIASIAAGAMAISSATPAYAGHRDRDGISAGDVIAGALVIGGIAAIASAASKNDRNYRDYRGYPGDYGYDRGYDNDARWRGNPRQAVEQCVRAAEQYGSQYSYGRADVVDIRQVKDTRYGFEVKGRIAVNTRGRGWNRGDNAYGQGWGGDYRGWNQSMRGYDSGSFKCKYERGRVVDVDIDGIRGF